MLIDETRDIVNLVVDHEVEILLGVVGSNIAVGELLVRHGDCSGCSAEPVDIN